MLNLEVNKRYKIVVRRPEKSAIYTVLILEKHETYYLVLDKFNVEKQINREDLIEADLLKEVNKCQ